MKKQICILALLLWALGVEAQILYNNGANISVTNGGIVTVNGDFQNAEGETDNAGYVLIEGSLINDASLTGLGSSTGLFEVHQDWYNNGVFVADQSTVLLNTANQFIAGNVPSNFYNLTLDGTGIKTQAVDATVANKLALNDIELATEMYSMSVLSPDPFAISRGSGFVSSLLDGALYRNTNSTDVYLFPTGSSLGTFRYRPIEITPSTANDHTYGVRMVNNDPNFDAYDRAILDPEKLCAINPDFYHFIYRDLGDDPAEVKMFFDAAEDGQWNKMAHWQNVPQWESMEPEVPGFDAGFSTISVEDWNDYVERPFALGAGTPDLDAGPDVEIINGESIILMPDYIGASIDSVYWYPAAFLDCDDCLTVEASPTSTTDFVVSVKDVNGCLVADSVLVNVKPARLIIPNAFSPNGDGVNDVFKPLNLNLETASLSIYNRWGELLFETNVIGEAWDGTYKGEPVELGVYMYHLEYRFIGESYTQFKGENVTVVR